jgi:antitoxin FitA
LFHKADRSRINKTGQLDLLTTANEWENKVSARSRARLGKGRGAAIIDSSPIIKWMPTITIRRLDETTKARLRIRSAHHGRSMEAEAREILRLALARQASSSRNLAAAIRERFAEFGGVELQAMQREPLREPPSFRK